LLEEKSEEIVNIKLEFNKAYSKLDQIEKEEKDLLQSKISEIWEDANSREDELRK